MAKKNYDKLPIKNTEMRALIIGNGVRYRELADAIHISGSQLSMWLSQDLTDYRREEILKGLEAIRAEREMI